jgi:hypothetical protein
MTEKSKYLFILPYDTKQAIEDLAQGGVVYATLSNGEQVALGSNFVGY